MIVEGRVEVRVRSGFGIGRRARFLVRVRKRVVWVRIRAMKSVVRVKARVMTKVVGVRFRIRKKLLG